MSRIILKLSYKQYPRTGKKTAIRVGVHERISSDSAFFFMPELSRFLIISVFMVDVTIICAVCQTRWALVLLSTGALFAIFVPSKRRDTFLFLEEGRNEKLIFLKLIQKKKKKEEVWFHLGLFLRVHVLSHACSSFLIYRNFLPIFYYHVPSPFLLLPFFFLFCLLQHCNHAARGREARALIVSRHYSPVDTRCALFFRRA